MQNSMPLFVTTMIALAVSLSDTAEAGHDYRLSEATILYQEAVSDFARCIVSDHRLTRFERQHAPLLLVSANRFHALVLHSNDLRRLKLAWLEIEELQLRIERVLFSHRGCPIWRAHRAGWDHVLYDSRLVRRSLDRMGCFRPPRYCPPVVVPPRVPSPHRPDIDPSTRWQSSYRYPSPLVRSYRYPSQVRDLADQFRHQPSRPRNDSKPPHFHRQDARVSRLSPSEAQISEAQRGIGRQTGRARIGPTRLGAVVSRRAD